MSIFSTCFIRSLCCWFCLSLVLANLPFLWKARAWVTFARTALSWTEAPACPQVIHYVWELPEVTGRQERKLSTEFTAKQKDEGANVRQDKELPCVPDSEPRRSLRGLFNPRLCLPFIDFPAWLPWAAPFLSAWKARKVPCPCHRVWHMVLSTCDATSRFVSEVSTENIKLLFWSHSWSAHPLLSPCHMRCTACMLPIKHQVSS